MAEICKSQTNKIEYIYNIKAIAILMVVFLHSVSPLFYQLGQISQSAWYVTVFYDSFVRCCVPLFLIANGVTILNKDYQLSNWIKNKIFSRLCLPFLFYFVFYSIIKHKSLITIFNLSDLNYHFPFFSLILTLYILYPIIRAWIKNTSKGWIYYFLILWFSATVTVFFFPNFSLFNTNFIYNFIGFPIIGYFLSKIDTTRFKYWGLLIYILCSIITFFATMNICKTSGVPNEKYFGYLSPNVIFMSIGLFLFIKNTAFELKNKAIIGIRDFLSNHSYGIYFLHPCILLLLYKLQNRHNPLFTDWILFMVGIIITSVLIFLLNKIPILKKFVG